MTRSALLTLAALVGACSPAPPAIGAPPTPEPGPATATAAVSIVVAHAPDTLALDDSSRSALFPGAALVQWKVEPAGLGALTALGDSVLLTRLPAEISLASASERFIVTPLRWDLSYVLVARSSSDFLPVEASGANQVRRDLASNAVRVSARPAGPMYWWQNQVPCDSSIAAATTIRPAVGYPADDATAGLIASRLAAIAPGSAGRVTAVALAGRELGFALADGRLAGVVVPIGTTPGSALPASLACSVTLTPLIDVRAHLIHRVLP